MSTSKKKGLGRGLTALFGDQTPEPKKNEKRINNRSKANISDLSPSISLNNCHKFTIIF